MTKAELQAQADALKAINIAKYKSQGKNYRLEVRIHDSRGIKEVKVYYSEKEPTATFAVQTLLKNKSKCLSDFVIEAI